MKKLVYLLIFLGTGVYAQKPEPVYRLTIQPRDDQFYSTQADLWKKEVAKRPKDASAWENYYWAMRYSNHLYETGHVDKQKAMAQIMDDMGRNVPGTIQYYRCKLSYDGWPNKDTANTALMLKKAIALAPNDRTVLEDYITYSAVSGNGPKFKEMSASLYKSNTYAYGMMELGYNLLMSADKNSIVFTWGDNDTYTTWMLQQAKGIRTDITIINVPLAMNYTGYLKQMLLEKNIVLSEGFWERSKQANGTMDFMKMLLLEINKVNSSVPLFMEIESGLENTFPDSLYCTGLTYRFSTVRIDNISKLRNNVEDHFHLDYLNGYVPYDNGLSEELVEDSKTQYVTPFAILYRHYRQMGENNDRVQFYKDFVMKYAAKAGKEKEMEEYLEGK